jgi:uncharacterized protein
MKFQQRCIIPAARDEVWDFLLDLPRMASCIPGAEDVTPDGDSQYNGRLRFKLGPIRVSLQGIMKIQERDREHWRATARAEAKDIRVGGGANVTGFMTLVEKTPSTTELTIEGEARFLGKLGEFGEPVIRRQADTVVAAFARNVAAHFEGTTAPGKSREPGAEEQPGPKQAVPGASPVIRVPWIGVVSGLAIAILLVATADLFAPVLRGEFWGAAIIIVAALLGAGAEILLRKRLNPPLGK